jgi:organic radical activating enzyme
MQYYRNPKDCDIDEIMRSIDAFCAVIDEVNEFRVIGGEPFMNKEMHLVVKKLIDEPKVRKIVIYTNGTIVPKEEQIESLKNGKVFFIITDYGKLSRKIDTLTQVLQQNNIAYFILKVEGWSDCAKMIRHQRNPEQQKKLFTDCCAKNLVTLSNGKLYRCPFAANAARLMAVPDYKEDYINVIRWPQDAIDIFEIKKRIRTFLLEKTFFETCDYCNGRPLGTPAEIPPAIQTKRPLEYDRNRVAG